jgi:carbamoyl-phosphate synthase small subunit
MWNSGKIPGMLVLADGSVFTGTSFGAVPREPVGGEAVFNTSMYGYQEILTDPSYAGQIMSFTYPHIGNVGCNDEDEESDRVHVSGVVVRDISKIVSSHRAQRSLDEYLRVYGVPGLTGVDTRGLVRHIRDHGAQMGVIAVGDTFSRDELVDRARQLGSMEGKDYVIEVSCKRSYSWNELPWRAGSDHPITVSQENLMGRPHVVAVDCGIKRNILRLLVQAGFRVTVVPATTSAEEILQLKPDGLFLSNGPGDPAALRYIVQPTKLLLGKVPIFGICLGHQVLAQALGGSTYKLKFGHRGGNHPVKDFTTGKTEITVQNHGFAVADQSLPKDVRITHLNLNDNTVEGLEVSELNVFSVQYHPEASPGPRDAAYLFERFFNNVAGRR